MSLRTVCLLVLSGTLASQLVAQPATFTPFRGKLTDAAGRPLPGVQIRITNTTTGQAIKQMTAPDGVFQFPNSHGNYRFEAKSDETAFRQERVVISPGQFVNFGGKTVLYVAGGGGGPISVGTAFGGGPATSLDVLEKTLKNETEALNWLSEQGDQNLEVTSIVAIADAKSLFTLRRLNSKVSYYALSVKEHVNLDAIKRHVNEYAPQVFVGVHRIRENFWLMIFRQE
jgi:Carboxypeptidase regulatory-like domain